MTVTLVPSALQAPATTLARAAVDFLFPERCVACGRFGKPLCLRCSGTLQELAIVPGCSRCASPLAGDSICPHCRSWDAIDTALPAFHYEGAARKMVHALKYRRQRSLLPYMARYLAGPGSIPDVDATFPVPLHPARFRRRGFNQAERLHRSLGWIKQEGRLRRIRDTRPQVGLNPGQRRANVASAFAYAGPPLDGLQVAIIDDVITTGATVNECARVLRANGATRVTVIAFARARGVGRSPEAVIDD